MGGVYMTKAKLNLSIDTDLLELAKNSTLNLSQEFEEWVKIRLINKSSIDIINVDYDLEKAKLLQELALLESKEEISKRQELKEKEEVMILKSFIDNIKEFDTLPLKDDDLRTKANGLIFLFKQKLNKVIRTDQAIEMIKKELDLNAD